MEIQNFRNAEFGSLRVIQNEKGEMMFCLADVCKALGIGNPSQMKMRLDGGYLISNEVSTQGKNQYNEFSRTTYMTFIGEPNFYRCIFQSKKAGAKRFQDWVFGDYELPAAVGASLYVKPKHPYMIFCGGCPCGGRSYIK